MTLDAPIFDCPKCKTPVEPAPPTEFIARDDHLHHCRSCGWQGQIFAFNPIEHKIEYAQAAMADDAVCLHHPTKRATTVCAGTGDYICSLCAIELDGKIYGAHYLSTAGIEVARMAFTNRLPRPDSEVLIACITSIPFFYVSPFIFCYGLWRLIEAFKLRRTNPLFAQVVSVQRLVMLGVLGCVIAFSGLAGFVVIVAEIAKHR